MIRVVHPGSGSRFSRIPVQGSKRHRIPDPHNTDRTLSFLVSRVACRFLMEGFVSKARFRRFFLELAIAAAAATPTGPAHNPRRLFSFRNIFFVGGANFFFGGIMFS
jgi:hypothetical protein